MKIPKDHVAVTNWIEYSNLEGPLDIAIQTLTTAANGILDPKLYLSAYDGFVEITIEGYRPMTSEELEIAKRDRKLNREAAKRRKKAIEDKERTEYERLKAKYESKEGS